MLPLQGVTDCAVLIGTNNLGSMDASQITPRLEVLFGRLRPFCRVWAGTLLPKERTTVGTLPEVNARRQAVNAWIRTQAQVAGIIDFEAVTRRPDNPDCFQDGLAVDGIHPSVAGHKKMGEEAARFLAQAPVVAVSSSNPTEGPLAGGTTVGLTGSGFKAGLTVTFGGQPATNVQLLSATQATASAPAHAAGTVSVVASTPDGQQASLPGGYTYRQDAPPLSLAAVQPKNGPPEGGNALALRGSGFVAGATVYLDGKPATNVRVDSDASITFVAPAHARGVVDVEVRQPDGARAILPGSYRYTKGPWLEVVAPDSGVAGQQLTLQGGDFTEGATVSFDSARVVGTVSADGVLRVTAPAHASGPADVTVTNPDGLSATLPAGFVYVPAAWTPSPPEFGSPQGAAAGPCRRSRGCSSARG